MLEVQGHLSKMSTALKDNQAHYWLTLDQNNYHLNPYLASCAETKITIEFLDSIQCVHCQRVIKKTFNQGYCFPCFRALASCDICILSPDRCHFHLDTCREPAWALDHCFQPHICYIANSSSLKVGLTRATQLPTRWIDQGATQALIIATSASRYQAGLLEMICKQHVNDKTNWREMLKHQYDKLDLYSLRDTLYNKIEEEISELQLQFNNNQVTWTADELITEINYPVIEYPKKITSLDLEKLKQITGKLKGIKGQYLILDSGVINLRKYTGYAVRITLHNASLAVTNNFSDEAASVIA